MLHAIMLEVPEINDLLPEPQRCSQHSNIVTVCPDNCDNRTCMSDGVCCHKSCLGGCTGPGSEDCLVCRDVVFEKRCLQQCPPDTYKVKQMASYEETSGFKSYM